MVEIIPKIEKEIPRWQIILFYFLIFFLIMTVVVYFLLENLYKKNEDSLSLVENKISEGRSEEMIGWEEEVSGYKAEIDDFKPFLENHIITSKFFDFLQAKTHPRVFFFSITLNSELQKAIISGLTDSFVSLGQQLELLKDDSAVKKLELANVSLGEEGGIEFELNILLKEKIFRY